MKKQAVLRVELRVMKSASVCWMQSAAISQHGPARTAGAYLSEPCDSVPQSELARSLTLQRRGNHEIYIGGDLTRRGISIFAAATGECVYRSFHPAGHWTFATIARLQQGLCAGAIAVDSLPSKMHAKRFYVSGKVQGVGFRFFAEGTASRLGLGGYVKNLFDGRVEVYAIGDERQLHALRDALEQGPRMAAVDQVEERDAEILKEYTDGFTIEHEY